MLAAVPTPVFAASRCTAPATTAYGTTSWTYDYGSLSDYTQNSVRSYAGAQRWVSYSDSAKGTTGWCTYTTSINLAAQTTYLFTFSVAGNYGSWNSSVSTGQSMGAQINGVTYWSGSTRSNLPGTLIPTDGSSAVSGSFTYTPSSSGYVAFRYGFLIQVPGSGGSDDIAVTAPVITC